MNETRAFGRVPRSVRGKGAEKERERLLAKRLQAARTEGCLSSADLEELSELRANELGGVEEAEAPGDPSMPSLTRPRIAWSRTC